MKKKRKRKRKRRRYDEAPLNIHLLVWKGNIIGEFIVRFYFIVRMSSLNTYKSVFFFFKEI